MAFIDAATDPRQAKELLQQLESVYAARAIRLERQQQEMDAERIAIEQELAALERDADLIVLQQQQWAQSWQGWQRESGSLAIAKRLTAQRQTIEATAARNAQARAAVAQKLAATLQKLAQLARRRHANEARQALVEEDRGLLRRQHDAAQTRAADDTAEERAALAWLATNRTTDGSRPCPEG